MFRTEQQNASYSDNILSHGRVPVSDQSNLERYVLHIRLPMGESIREVEEYQVQLLNVSVLELLTLQCQTAYVCAAHCDLKVSVRMVTGHRETAETKDGFENLRLA